MSSIIDEIAFTSDGLVPAIAQQHDSGEVLMMAWMNAESVAETLATGQVCYWSRSRQSLWRKGESSGQVQKLKELRLDCDGDTILMLVDQTGVACHTGRRNCFYRAVRGDAFAEMRATNTEMWQTVFAEDVGVVEGMQRGRHATGYDGGKFSAVMDAPTHHFHSWVAGALSR